MFPLSPYVRISQRNTSTTGVTALLLTRSHLTGISYLKNASLNTLYSFNIRFTSRTRPTVSTLSRKKKERIANLSQVFVQTLELRCIKDTVQVYQSGEVWRSALSARSPSLVRLGLLFIQVLSLFSPSHYFFINFKYSAMPLMLPEMLRNFPKIVET